MKALRKKYGKRAWIDTPNADWYRKRCLRVRGWRALIIQTMAAASHSRISQIRATPANDPFSQAKKSLALARAVLDMHIGVARVIQNNPLPSPNPSVDGTVTKRYSACNT